MTCPMMMSLGVYVLGAADHAERRRLEAHLPGCGECLTELSRLAPLPGLLAGLPESVRAVPQAPGPRSVPVVPGRRAVPPRRAPARGRTRRHLAVAAAACLAAGVSVGVWLSSGSGGHPATVLTFAGTDSATHVSATATVTATSWGSSIQLQVDGLPENVECRLVVRSVAGRTEVSGVWDAWAKGPVSIPGSASWLPSDIVSLEVTTSANRLVTMSASHPAPGGG
jgi:Putative zinc-finger